MGPQRYYLDTDNDSHWYLIPEEYRADWETFLSLDSEDEHSWNVPAYARELGGGPNQVTFECPQGGGA